MPITFEEVTADIEHEPQRGTGERERSTQPAPQDLRARLEETLRLLAERDERICDC